MNQETDTTQDEQTLVAVSAWAILFSLKRLLTWPGDVAVGFVLAGQALGWVFSPSWPMVAAMVLAMVVITFLQGRFVARHLILGPLCEGLTRPTMVLLGAFLAGGVNLSVGLAATGLGIFAVVANRIAIEPADPPRRAKPLILAMMIATGVVVLPLIVVGFVNNGIAAISPWAGVWIGLWAMARVAYFANAMKGWPTAGLLGQVGDQLLRSFFLLQALFVVAIVTGSQGALAFAVVFVLFPVYSLLTKWFPGPAWR